MENEKTTKDLMLQRALHLFAEKGYESVGVQELCTVCGVTKPTLYYYFSNKLGLFHSIFDTDGREFCDQLTQAAVCDAVSEGEGEAFHQTLTRLVMTMYSFAREHEDFFRLFYSLSANVTSTESQDLFSAWKSSIDTLFDDLFIQASELFGNMRGFESMYARLFLSTAAYSVFQALSGSLTLDEETAERITHAFLWGVAS